MDRDELLELIDRAAREGWMELDLRGRGLTELPPEVGQLTQLRSLNLESNRLTTLPPEIGQLSQLQKLNVWGNQLTTLPPEMGQLTQLKSVDLGGNQLTALPQEILQLTQLQSLKLNVNRLTTLPSEIGQLTQLQSLNLNDNQLTTLPPELWQSTQLQSLALGSNDLRSLPPEIAQLSQLQSLILNDNRLTLLPPEIGRLTHLHSLKLNGDQLITIPCEIGQLTQLQSLNLNGNQLTALPPEIGRLTQLQSLQLNDNQLTTLPSELWELTQLQSLALGSNDLTSLPPEIAQLTKLQCLIVNDNHLTSLPPEIGQLTRLQSLNLNGNRLTAFPPEIGRLTQLQSLELNANQLTTLPSELWGLTQLQSLALGSNDLTSLPPEIALLTELQCLIVNDNHLTSLPPEIGQLTQLQFLKLNGNRLTTLPPEIGQLSQLQSLDINGNQLTSLPSQIGRLIQLQSLQLTHNQLTALTPEIGQLTNLTELNLRDNPLPIPPEILAQVDDPQAIITTYLDLLAGQRRPLNEVKMVLVGQGSVGKTSLVTCLLDGPAAFDPHETKTEGIDIRRWQLPHPASPPQAGGTEGGAIRVNVWDFGGQEIMHATHQFFLTHRTLYLLVLDTRLSEAENRLDYWLQIVRSFGGDSPVILVGNKVDQQPLDIDRGGIRDKYPSIKAIVATSCTNGEGIDALQAAIAEQVPTLPHVFDELLATWFDVKAQLEEMEADYIPYAQYAQMCQEAGVTKESSQRTLLGFLHDLGIVLHFPDPRLETTNILNPEWVTQGVYRILNSHALFQDDGVLTPDLLTQILDRPEYPRDKHFFIVDMMRKFELCYPFPGQAHTYLVPDLLPKEERYTGTWDDALAFQVHYNVLPGSVISRFIVRMHRCIHQHTVWRTGVLLALNGNEALVRADLADNRIHIRVRGPTPGRRDLLTRIREQLDAIHHTIRGLQVEEKVPLSGHPELPPVDYRHLRNLERAGIDTWIPEGLTEPISVSQLLDGVEPPSARRDGPIYKVDARGAQIGTLGDRPRIQDGMHFESEQPKPHRSVEIRENQHPNQLRKEARVDPVTGAIVAALAAGVAGGLAGDAYKAIKAAIKKKYGEDSDLAEAVEKLEQKPESAGWKEEVATQVQATNAAQDPECLALAERLTAALEETAAGQQALSKYSIQMQGSQVGVIGDHAHIEGGMHFGGSGDTFDMSGDFRGAYLNVKSTLTNVTQTISALPHTDPSIKAELEKLVKELNDALQQVPADKAEDAGAVAQSAELLVEKATEEEPNKTTVQITGEGLKKAAQNLADVMPTVLTIATQIVATVSRLVAQR